MTDTHTIDDDWVPVTDHNADDLGSVHIKKEMSDAEVFGDKPDQSSFAPAQKEMSDAEVFGTHASAATAPDQDPMTGVVPEAFLDRVRAGQALTRIFGAAVKEGKDGLAGGTPTGFSDETLGELIDAGIFHDPAKGRPSPIQFANESILMPTAQAWQAVTGAISAGIHGAGGALGQIVEEFGGSQGTANRAKNEVINAGNWALIESGMGRFSRPAVSEPGIVDQPVGGLPRPEDFTIGGKVMESSHAETNLKRMWSEDGIHPAEAVHDAQTDAFLAHEITAPREVVKLDPEIEKIFEETGGKPASLSAAVTEPSIDVPLDVQPAQPPGKMTAMVQDAAERLFDVGRDIQMKLTPMARGSTESMATVKDYMNSMRRNSWDLSRIDADLVKRFSPEDRARMWQAMDEESLSLRLGEPASAREHQGLATLTPEQRQVIVDLDTRQQLAWLRARDLGMVEGEGIPMHAPRMITSIKNAGDREGAMSIDALGYDLRTKTGTMKQRKYLELEETEKAAKAKFGEQATVARDIRTVALGTKQLEDAIAGRTLIENIKDVGKRTGDEVVAEGFKPDPSWFTMDHPAFRTWRPKFEEMDGKIETVKDANGKPVFEQVPIYVRGDFEGPLRAAMWGKSGEDYKALMSLKGKTMSLIMNSPMIHNLVEFGRAFPAMPTRIVKAYFDGNRAKFDPAIMHEAIDSGLVPIGKRFFNQDITSIMEAPDLTPGRSWTAKVLSAVPGLFDEAAGVAVKRAVDKAGDFWHNTLLWDRIADLQMGLYVNFRGDMIAKGMDQQTASRVAAHLANRYAGALPKEAMSEAATKVANMLLFSRSFTLGNLGVLKDMFTGLPKDVIAQIERDAGFGKGAIEAGDQAKAIDMAKSMARRKAIATVGLDIALMYVGNSVLQSAFNVMLGQGGWTQEGHEYMRRMRDLLNEAKVHPLALLNPFHVTEKLSATDDNEPGRKDRIMIGMSKDGTAIYARNPVGKIGEEFTGYFGSPIDMLKKKEGTVMRPIMQIIGNDAGFGRKVYDPTADTPSKYAGNIWAIVKHIVGSQLPSGQISAFSDLVKGQGDAKVNALQALGPFAGVTFSKGAPGGPAVGEYYANKSALEFRVAQAMPDIRRQILRGDIIGAQQRMAEIGMDPSYQRWVVRTTINPATRLSARGMRDFYRTSTQEQKDRLQRALSRKQ